MFTMIFVNDLAGAPHKLVPDWMVHYSDRHKGSGMTFVDLVFPAFLFIVGMSIPFALGSRLKRGEPIWKTLLHVLTRSLALIVLGIMMVNESPNSEAMGWSATLWVVLMYSCAILAFCSVSPRRKSGTAVATPTRWLTLSRINLILRLVGFAGLIALAFAFRGRNDHRIIRLSPSFSINHDWYGILGLIGWAYLVASIVFLVFRTSQTGLLMCMVLLMCLFPADRKGLFEGFNLVSVGETLGSQASITVGGVLLASILLVPWSVWERLRFTLLFILGCAIAAVLLKPLYGISKNNATPAWCLWSCAVTAGLWLLFYFLADVWRPTRALIMPFAVAGKNVLLAYLISEGMGAFLDLVHLGDWYGSLTQGSLAHAVERSLGAAFVVLLISVVLNRLGFRLKL
jgi:predicted acyltransferase